MTLRSVATACGLVGGLCWVLRAISDQEVLLWAGFALLGIAAACAGAALVASSAVPLRLFVGVACPLLLWSVLEVARNAGSEPTVDVLFGVAAVLAAGAAWLTQPARGSHAPTRSKHAA